VTMAKDLVAELIGMFFAEKRMTLAVLALVAVTGWLVDVAGTDRLVGGAVLLFGSLTLLLASVCRAARVGAS
jgi:hypothetical protein